MALSQTYKTDSDLYWKKLLTMDASEWDMRCTNATLMCMHTDKRDQFLFQRKSGYRNPSNVYTHDFGSRIINMNTTLHVIKRMTLLERAIFVESLMVGLGNDSYVALGTSTIS
jgi:hypothetical protein